MPTPIMLQRMRKDGITPDGLPIQLLDRTPEDGPLVEAPDIVRSKEGVYFLFYSSGCTTDSSYVRPTPNVSLTVFADSISGHQICDCRSHHRPVHPSPKETSDDR